jgi:ABC-type cobalamin transport system ATPase subunit
LEARVMKTVNRVDKRLLRPERLRQVPAQFSWVDQALVQRHLIDRCEARAAALYLFLVTVADAQGLSYYGGSTLAQRLALSAEELAAARAQLVELELIAYAAPLYQVLALSEPSPSPSSSRNSTGPLSVGELLAQLERRRDRL